MIVAIVLSVIASFVIVSNRPIIRLVAFLMFFITNIMWVSYGYQNNDTFIMWQFGLYLSSSVLGVCINAKTYQKAIKEIEAREKE